MRKMMLILLVLIGPLLRAQNSSESKDTISFHLSYGYRTLFQNFYDQLNTVESFDWGAPLQIAGFRASGRMEYLINYFEAGYAFIIPLRETIKDSLSAKIAGYTYGFCVGRIMENKYVDFTYYAGLGFGRTTIFGNSSILRKNPFFGPKVGISPGIKLWRFGLALDIEYEYDISSPKWRKLILSPNKDVLPVDGLRQSALTTTFVIKYTFH
jgi:hypothetical protein